MLKALAYVLMLLVLALASARAAEPAAEVVAESDDPAASKPHKEAARPQTAPKESPAPAPPKENPAPDTPPVTTPPKDGDAAETPRAPIVVDEPNFKAKAVFPEKPIPKFEKDGRPGQIVKTRKKDWALAQEEGVDSDVQIESTEFDSETDKEAANHEEISPALAKVISREKGKKAKEMAALYQEAASAEPQSAPAQYRLGLALVRAGDVLNGLKALESALVLKPKNTKYQCDYGLAALQIGLTDKALMACQSAALSQPATARYHSALGDCLVAAGRNAEAMESYTRALSCDPNNPHYVYNMGMACMYGRDFKRAIESFNEAIRMRGDFAPYFCSRGLAQENLKNIKPAIQDYATALKLDKNNAYAHFLLAGVYSDPDDPTFTNKFEAVEHAEKAVKLTQYRNAQYLMGLARALRVARNYEQAVAVARKAVALDPRDDYRADLAKFEQLNSVGYTGSGPVNQPSK